MRCLVRQHRLADDIADGEDVRHVGAHLFVHSDKAIVIDRNAGILGADQFAVGAAADGDQHAVINFDTAGGFRVAVDALEAHMDAVFFRLHGGDLGIQHDFLETLFHALLQWAHQIAVAALNQAVGEFDDADFAAEGVIYGTHFQTDDAAADDQDALRDVGQRQRAGGIHDARVFSRAGEFGGLRAGRDNGVFETHGRDLAVLSSDGDLVRAGEFADTLHDGDTALFRHLAETAGQLADDVIVFPVAQLFEVDLRRAETDAMMAGFLGFGDDLGRVQQSLGWNTADIQTNAAQRGIALDQHHLLAQIGSAESGGVAAGAGAEDDYFGMQIGVSCL